MFSLVHGKNVGDGSIKALLDFYKIPNNSSDLIPSGVCQDKVLLKDVLKTSGINVVDYIWFYDYEWYQNYKKVLDLIQFDYPVIVKPATLGSSIGIQVCHKEEELTSGIVVALKYDNKILIEKYIENTEYTISLMGSKQDVFTSEIEEVNEGLYSFEKKYENKFFRTNMVIDENIQELAVTCFKLLGLKGVVRIDILKEKENLYINEINPIPGSLSKYLWNLPNSEFYEKLINICSLEDNLINSFESSILQNQVNKMSKFI